MKTPFPLAGLLLLFSLAAPGGFASGRPADGPSLPVPTPEQAAWQDLELGIFFHFGINTFHDREWSDGTLPASSFNPVGLDAGQWVRAAREAGARYVVYTAKHHDGFCLWPTATTDYSVKSSPFREGQGDVVKEVAEACRREGMKLGLYLSPWDRHEPSYSDPPAYDRFYCRQLEELTGGYGPLVEVWFDGAGSAGRSYDWEKIIGVVRKRQPQAMVFNMGAPTIRWSGNERGFAPEPSWNVVREEDVLRFSEGKASSDGRGTVWLPAECDVPIRGGWFWSPRSEGSLKSLEELLTIYYRSVGSGANLLLNVAPDDRGLLPDVDLARLSELAREIRRRFGKSLQSTSGKGEALELAFGREERVDHLVLAEDIRAGERIRSYVLEAERDGQWKPLARGRSVGHKRIRWFEPVRARAVRLRVLESAAEPLIRELSAFDVGGEEYEALRARFSSALEREQEDILLGDLSRGLERLPAFGPLHLARARLLDAKGDFEGASRDYDRVLSLDEGLDGVYHARADARFKLARFRDAIRDYDRSIAGGGGHDEKSCWERGLAFYYVGDFAAARRQFEGYHTFDGADIENGLWRYLSILEGEGAARALETLYPYPRRVRPPFPALHDLYAGKGSVEAVLDEARREARTDAERGENLFYAHYYAGKHLEALRKPDQALPHLEEALKHPLSHFMYQCARIDRDRVQAKLGEGVRIPVRFATVEEGRKLLAARDGFIANLSPFDRAARLRKGEAVSEEDFLAFAAAQARPWKEDETARVQKAFETLEKKARGLKLDLPDPLLLVKTTGEEEANTAYTRANAIVLAETKAALRGKELEGLLTHELFHVLSRHRPARREALYRIVGFEPAGTIDLPPGLKERKLTNPDAPAIDCYLETGKDGASLAVTPVLYSKEARFDPAGGGDFFRYLTFRLMAIEKRDGRWVPSLREGAPLLLEPHSVPAYQEKIGRNTGYTIHPEEALADNFVLLLDGKTDVPTPRILEEMRKVLSP